MAKRSPHIWLIEPLAEEPSLIEKRMFGCDAVYLHGRLQLVLCPGVEDPWRGVLVATERDYHQALIAEFPALAPHPVLGKWLYLDDTHDQFESVAQALVRLVAKGDPRIGVLPETRRRIRRRAPQS